tara:strand:+ start:282 stop:521 length:240 start_codon:yes stop_codon:yes gene_type:complete
MSKPKNLFTDIGAAMEEAVFLREQQGKVFALIQETSGMIWVAQKCKAVGMSIMWDTTKRYQTDMKHLHHGLEFGHGASS